MVYLAFWALFVYDDAYTLRSEPFVDVGSGSEACCD